MAAVMGFPPAGYCHTNYHKEENPWQELFANPCDEVKSPILEYRNAEPEDVYDLSQQPDLRMVHWTRKPSNIVASWYSYSLRLDAGCCEMDYDPWNIVSPEQLSALSLSQGLSLVCNISSQSVLKPMVTIHEYIKPFKNILPLRFEDAESDYDNTMRSFWEHFFGSSDHRLQEQVFLVVAKKKDSHSPLWDGNATHMSDEDSEAKVHQEMKNLLKAGDPCMQELNEMNKRMGYDEGFE